MIKVRIQLEGSGNLWQVKDSYINYDDQTVEQLGPVNERMEYEEAIKEAKRWTMLKLRHKGRTETEDDVFWNVDPSLPPRHIPRL